MNQKELNEIMITLSDDSMVDVGIEDGDMAKLAVRPKDNRMRTRYDIK